jgi:hypothetical protein
LPEQGRVKPFALYTVTVAGADLAGNPLPPTSFEFATGADPAFDIKSHLPPDGAGGVATSKPAIRIEFTVPIDKTSLVTDPANPNTNVDDGGRPCASIRSGSWR